jgi:hypothetical protein
MFRFFFGRLSRAWLPVHLSLWGTFPRKRIFAVDRLWLFIERACSVLAIIIGAATLYFTAGAYYNWNQPIASPSSVIAGSITMIPGWWIMASGGIGALLLGTAWIMIIIRLRRQGELKLELTQTMPPSSATASNVSEPPEPSNITTLQPTIKRGLYVGDIRASFDKLRNDYVLEISIRAYNGTGGIVSLSEITGSVRYGTLDMQDVAYESLPPVALLNNGQPTKGIPIFTETVLALEQRMPSESAMKLLTALDEGNTAVFDLRQFNILLSLDSSPDETERLPVFNITCKKHETIDQGRIAYAAMSSIG